jgi:deoxyribodipyrimidine photo-lyase
MKTEIALVWLKRDLRTVDHAPLFYAHKTKLPIVFLYCFEPSLQKHFDWDVRHWRFIYQSLQYLKSKLPSLLWTYEEVMPTLDSLSEHFDIKQIFCHQETGVELTFERDKAISRWCKRRGVDLKQYQHNGVVRGLRQLSEWERLWASYMRRQPFNVDLAQVRYAAIPQDLGLNHELPAGVTQHDRFMQLGGENLAWDILKDFSDHRYFEYCKNISTPSQGKYSCSRLSPYIAWGNISIRSIYQEMMKLIKGAPERKNLLQYINRLKWHCHFIQKFEMNEEMESKNLLPGLDHLRNDLDKSLFAAWKEGRTGFPLVDASMRCVAKTGYLNFRMRALVVSFLTHHLWQPWQEGSKHMARQFLDYEPGIHFSQFQQQAGVLGSSLHIYNPVKQSKDKDSDGLFIKEWIPELRRLPVHLVHEPWKITDEESEIYGFKIGEDYPRPMVNLVESTQKAESKLGKALLMQKRKLRPETHQ